MIIGNGWKVNFIGFVGLIWIESFIYCNGFISFYDDDNNN